MSEDAPILFLVTLRNAAFGVEVTDGVVTAAAPIAKWCCGKSWESARQWFAAKGGTIERASA